MIIYRGIEVRTIPELLALLANTAEPEQKNGTSAADQNGNTTQKAEKQPEKEPKNESQN